MGSKRYISVIVGLLALLGGITIYSMTSKPETKVPKETKTDQSEKKRILMKGFKRIKSRR